MKKKIFTITLSGVKTYRIYRQKIELPGLNIGDAFNTQ